MTMVGIEPRLCDQGRRKNDIFTLSATLAITVDMLEGCLRGATHQRTQIFLGF